MMKFFFTLLFSVAISGYGQDAVLQWAKSMGGASTQNATAIAVDAAGNVFSTGGYQSTADFDPGPGVFNLTPVGAGDIFVSKLDASGDFVWAIRMGGTAFEAGRSIAVDAMGNVYITGFFQGTADFDPGPGTYNLTPVGGLDLFICKLNASGEFVWAIGMGNASTSGYDNGESIRLDALGNVYVTATFIGAVDFDPGAGTFNLTAVGNMDAFFLKLTNSGAFVWAKSIGGTFIDEGFEIAVDALGNVYATGYYFGTADLDPGAGVNNVTSAGSYDIFVLKLDPLGDVVWSRSMGGPSDDRGFSLVVDGSGNVYTSGHYAGTADFDPGAGVQALSSNGGTLDVFISKLNSNGDYVWVKHISGSVGDWAESLALNGNGVYITGRFTGTTDLDPGATTVSATSAGSLDIFVVKVTTAGDFVWGKTFGSTGDDCAYGIAADGSNNVYFTGDYTGTVDFDPGAGTANLSAVASSDVMVVKLGQTGILPIHLGALTGMFQNQQVALQWKSYDDEDAERYDVLHSTNGRNFAKIGSVSPRRANEETTYRYTHSTYAPGRNYYRILAKEYNGRQIYSNIIAIDAKGSETLTLLTNPVRDQLRLAFHAGNSQNIILHLYDAGGKKVGNTSHTVTKGQNLVHWDLQNLSAGYYMLEVVSTGGRYTVRVVKM